jgi:RNA polymerase sigma-70 factor (ECF subfamily)
LAYHGNAHSIVDGLRAAFTECVQLPLEGNLAAHNTPGPEPAATELEAATTDSTAATAAKTSEAGPLSKEQSLIRSACNGDTAAFGELIKLHYDTCLKRASSLMRSRTDAEDEVQNACWKAFERLAQFRGEGTFAAWLSRIVENQCLMRIREARQARFLYLDQSTESNVRVELVAQMPGPEEELGDQQLETLLQKEISRIPPLLRNVMVLSDIEHLPMPDVAARLGLSVPAAKSRLGRARYELRTRLKKYCGQRGYGTLTYKHRYGRLAYTRAT